MKLRGNERGDTLVEVIFSLIILTAVLVAVFSLGRQAHSQSSNSQTRIQAIDLVQEQYEALRNYRDRQASVTPWQDFLGAGSGGSAGNRIGISRRYDSPSSCIPAADCFHMERQSYVGQADYGQWVPCPGQWFPPLDYDSNWQTNSNPADGPLGSMQHTEYAYYQAFYHTYGCQGNANTHDDQPIIQVGMTVGAGTGLPAPFNCDYYWVNIVANWSTAGTSISNQAGTSLYSYLANIQGVDHYVTSPTCP